MFSCAGLQRPGAAGASIGQILHSSYANLISAKLTTYLDRAVGLEINFCPAPFVRNPRP